MQFCSTRNTKDTVSFSQAILDCLPADGGMYVPAYAEDLRPWINYMNENTSFQSIAGALTSALMQEEFSPLISEAIATRSFPFSPKLKQLDKNLYKLELFHGPTGIHKDFGLSYLTNCMEHILLYQEKTAVVLAPTNGETGSSIAHAFRDKKHIKAVLFYEPGSMRGVKESDCVWNGGNVYPVEMDAPPSQIQALLRDVYRDKHLMDQYNLTLANTINIGRLLPHSFLYMYAFSRIKKQVWGDICYALNADNYGNMVAGLYSWKFSLPVNGFITNSSPSLGLAPDGNCSILDSMVPLSRRGPSDPVNPSNIERLEEIFTANPSVMNGLVFPTDISEFDAQEGCKELLKKYGELVDPSTARAYAAAKKHISLVGEGGSTVVLVAADHPALYNQQIQQWCGESSKLPERIKDIYVPIKPYKKITPDRDSIERILEELD
ncbi:MAG TPA: threonine synthase [Treponemataceae bacterium]|nr:threonine synthase [Treponemataceae bacterium]